jgi:hypothetical protein
MRLLYAVTSRRANDVAAMVTAINTYTVTVRKALVALTSEVPPATNSSRRSPGKRGSAVLQAS